MCQHHGLTLNSLALLPEEKLEPDNVSTPLVNTKQFHQFVVSEITNVERRQCNVNVVSPWGNTKYEIEKTSTEVNVVSSRWKHEKITKQFFGFLD